MDRIATAEVVRTDILLYWMTSVLVLFLIDRYARKKLGGKHVEAYRLLAFPRMLALVFVTALSILLAVLFLFGQWTIRASLLTYLGIPYFTAWFFFLVNVLRRIRAETRAPRS